MRIKFNICLLVLLIAIQTKVFSQNTDIDILKSINKNESAFKNTYFKLNADAVTALSIGVPAGLAITGFILHNKKIGRAHV